MTYALLAVNGLLMIVTPLVLATFLSRRYRVEWGLFGAGAATFVAAQIVHVPFNFFVEGRYLPGVGEGLNVNLLLVALFYGLSAGLFEEVARYITYRFWRRDARSWSDGLMLGAGHGGVEALLLGFAFIINTTVLLGLARGYFTGLAPDGSLAEIRNAATALLSLPWYRLILGGAERVLAIGVHLALSLMVLRAVARRAPHWLLAAIAWHTLLNASVLVVAALAGVFAAELPAALMALASLWLILRWQESREAEPPVLPTLEKQERPAVRSRDTAEKLDDSRFV